MDEKRTFIFRPEWLDCINRFENQEDKYDLLMAIVSYGTGGKCEIKNPMIQAIFDALIFPQLEKNWIDYINKVNYGKTHGKEKKVNDEAIAELANRGYTAKMISNELGVSTDSIYHSIGWKNRNLQKNL